VAPPQAEPKGHPVAAPRLPTGQEASVKSDLRDVSSARDSGETARPGSNTTPDQPDGQDLAIQTPLENLAVVQAMPIDSVEAATTRLALPEGHQNKAAAAQREMKWEPGPNPGRLSAALEAENNVEDAAKQIANESSGSHPRRKDNKNAKKLRAAATHAAVDSAAAQKEEEEKAKIPTAEQAKTIASLQSGKDAKGRKSGKGRQDRRDR
jgi:hypothetical protein